MLHRAGGARKQLIVSFVAWVQVHHKMKQPSTAPNLTLLWFSCRAQLSCSAVGADQWFTQV